MAQRHVRALYLFVCRFRRYLATRSPYLPQTDFELMGYFLPRSLPRTVRVTVVDGYGTRRLCQERQVLVQGRLRLIRHCNRLCGRETGSAKLKRLIVPSHIALSCSGVLALGAVGIAESSLFSVKAGFTSGPTLLGIRAVPSVMAEKFIPMNRSIMSWVASNWSYPAMCEASNIYGELADELRLTRPW